MSNEPQLLAVKQLLNQLRQLLNAAAYHKFEKGKAMASSIDTQEIELLCNEAINLMEVFGIEDQELADCIYGHSALIYDTPSMGKLSPESDMPALPLPEQPKTLVIVLEEYNDESPNTALVVLEDLPASALPFRRAIEQALASGTNTAVIDPYAEGLQFYWSLPETDRRRPIDGVGYVYKEITLYENE